MTERKVFQSSMIQEGSYDSDTQTLEVTFTNGVTYAAEGVPPASWEGLKQASSPGRYYHQALGPLFNFQRT